MTTTTDTSITNEKSIAASLQSFINFFSSHWAFISISVTAIAIFSSAIWYFISDNVAERLAIWLLAQAIEQPSGNFANKLDEAIAATISGDKSGVFDQSAAQAKRSKIYPIIDGLISLGSEDNVGSVYSGNIELDAKSKPEHTVTFYATEANKVLFAAEMYDNQTSSNFKLYVTVNGKRSFEIAPSKRFVETALDKAIKEARFANSEDLTSGGQDLLDTPVSDIYTVTLSLANDLHGKMRQESGSSNIPLPLPPDSVKIKYVLLVLPHIKYKSGNKK